MQCFNGIVLLLVLQRVFECLFMLNALGILISDTFNIVFSSSLMMLMFLQTRNNAILKSVIWRLQKCVVKWYVIYVARFDMRVVMTIVALLCVVGDA